MSKKKEGYFIKCPKCKAHININKIINEFKQYFERFNSDFEEIRKRAGKIDIDYVVHHIIEKVKKR